MRAMIFRQRLPLLVAAVLAVAAPPLLAETIVVPVGASVADALLQAQPGDIVQLECGLHRAQGLIMPEGVVLAGASGEMGCAALAGDGSAPILICEDLSPATQIVGITFRGDPTAINEEVARGGAIYCRLASPQIRNCRFEDLQATYGGAVYGRLASDITFVDCVFAGNTARAIGGAVAVADSCRPRFTGCLIYGNEAMAGGGAIHAAMNCDVALDHCTVSDNGRIDWEGSVPALDFWAGSADTLLGAILAEESLWRGDDAEFLKPDCSNIYTPEPSVPVDPAFPYYIQLDPLFCANLAGDGQYNLDEASPCTPEASPGCGGMGAMPVGCALSPVDDPPPSDLPLVTRLREAFPNPFNPMTTIKYDVSRAGRVTLEVFDLAGRLVQVLVDEPLPVGHHEVSWRGTARDGRVVAAGVYFLRLKAADTRDTQRVTLVK
jgi:hypothetical protein